MKITSRDLGAPLPFLLNARTLMAAALLSLPMLLRAQDAAPTAANPAAGQALFAKLCSGCHGADGHGTEHGPALVGNRRVPQSPDKIRDLIHSGIPAAGMPAFNLPADQLTALASLV